MRTTHKVENSTGSLPHWLTYLFIITRVCLVQSFRLVFVPFSHGAPFSLDKVAKDEQGFHYHFGEGCIGSVVETPNPLSTNWQIDLLKRSCKELPFRRLDAVQVWISLFGTPLWLMKLSLCTRVNLSLCCFLFIATHHLHHRCSFVPQYRF